MPLERNPYYRRCCHEHGELERLLARIGEHFHNGRAGAQPLCWDRLTEMLSQLAEQVRQHFAHEEEGGYLEEAIARLPRLGPQANELERQHGPLLRGLAKLEEFLDQSHTPQAWDAVKREFARFAEALSAHEQAENALMDEAFCNEQLEA